MKAQEQYLQIITGKIFMRYKLEMEVKRKKILLEIILNSSLAFTEIMKMKRKKSRVHGRLAKTKQEKGAYNNIIGKLC